MNTELKVSNLSQSSGGQSNTQVLFEGITFCWKAPSLQVIMGASGCGKSTLLKSIAGVWPPLTGSIEINNKKLWNKSELNQEVLIDTGFAFQNNALFNSLTNIENLYYPHKIRFSDLLPKERYELAIEWLDRVGLGLHALSFPHELSGGMQKRLALARTLILRPKIIFLDDPTAGLDPITSEDISHLLKDLLSNYSALVILVTNDPERAKDWGPNIHFLHNNRLITENDESYKDARSLFLG